MHILRCESLSTKEEGGHTKWIYLTVLNKSDKSYYWLSLLTGVKAETMGALFQKKAKISPF